MLIVVSGLPAVGKSSVAARLAARRAAVHLSIDDVEDALLGSGFPQDWTTGVAAYEAVRAAAQQNLELGSTVVVDAVNDSPEARATWTRAAAGASAPVAWYLLQCDDEVEHRRRLESRHRGFQNLPEPTWEAVRAQRRSYGSWPGLDLVVDATLPLEEIVARIDADLPRHAQRS